MPHSFLKQLEEQINGAATKRIIGKVTEINDMLINAVIPGAQTGAIASINKTLLAQVASVQQDEAKLLMLGPSQHIAIGAPVELVQPSAAIQCGDSLKGRVINPLGTPMDSGGPLGPTQYWATNRCAPHPLKRPAVNKQLTTGIRVIDSLLSLGQGARIGLFAGPGQGKSTLLGNLATHTKCDVTVICLAGERGREAEEFVHRVLSPEARSRCVIILATSDAPAAERSMAITTATAVAEWFRDQGSNVLLLVDSLTRIVRARRDIDLALGYPLGPGGFPASTFSFLPSILERAAPNEKGTISAVYTVLAQKGNDLLTDEITSLLDGHFMLSKKRADAGKWPAIDVTASISRVMNNVISPQQKHLAARLRAVLAAWEENEELVLIGAYTKGSCRNTDAYLRNKDFIDAFVTQTTFPCTAATSLLELEKLVNQLDSLR